MDEQTKALLNKIDFPNTAPHLGFRYAEAKKAMTRTGWAGVRGRYVAASVIGGAVVLGGLKSAYIDLATISLFSLGIPHYGFALILTGGAALLVTRALARNWARTIMEDPREKFEYFLSRAIIAYNVKCDELRYRLEADETGFTPLVNREILMGRFKKERDRILRGLHKVKLVRKRLAQVHGSEFDQAMLDLHVSSEMIERTVNTELSLIDEREIDELLRLEAMDELTLEKK